MEQMIVQFIVNADRDVVDEIVAEFFCHAGIPMPALKEQMLMMAVSSNRLSFRLTLVAPVVSSFAHSWSPPF